MIPVFIMQFNLILFLSAASLFASNLHFLEETINIEIYSDDIIKVKGTYIFKSEDTSAIQHTLFYPFPVDSNNHYPSKISVYFRENNREECFERRKEGILISFPVAPGSLCTTTVVYKQHVNHYSGKYIITTTELWNEPLIRGYYSIVIYEKYNLSYLSYTCDTVIQRKNCVEYSFSRENFMPQKDIEFLWHPVEKVYDYLDEG